MCMAGCLFMAALWWPGSLFKVYPTAHPESEGIAPNPLVTRRYVS